MCADAVEFSGAWACAAVCFGRLVCLIPSPAQAWKDVQGSTAGQAFHSLLCISLFCNCFFFKKNIPSLSVSACCPALSTLFPCSQSGTWEIRKQLPSYFTSEVLPYFHKLSFVFAGVWKTRPDHPTSKPQASREHIRSHHLALLEHLLLLLTSLASLLLQVEEYSLCFSSWNEEEALIIIVACGSPSHPLGPGVVSALAKSVKPWEMLHFKGSERIAIYWSRRCNR